MAIRTGVSLVMVEHPTKMKPLQCGQTLGKYRILGELGRGGMGVVYLAEDTSLGRSVALKTLYPALAMDEEFIERFRAEARYVATQSHPGIVRIHSFEEIEGRATIDMEFIDGEALSSLILREVMTPHLVVSLVRSVVEALAECHAEGIVHRDVKPGNILVSKNGRALLTDFGLAKAYAHHLESKVHSTSSSGFFLGTPRYAPPEAWDSGAATPAWDVYSLGMVMYEALSGRLAYDGSTPLEIMRQMVAEPPRPIRELVPNVSEPLAALVDDLLDRDPARRPADAGAVLERLRSVPEFDSRDIESNSTVIMPKRARKWWRAAARRIARPRRLAKIAAAVALVLACAIAAVWYGETNGLPGNFVRRGKTAGVASQESIARSRLFSAPEMLALPRRAQTTGCSFFEVSFLEKDSDLDALWMVIPDESGGDSTIIALANSGLYRLSMKTNAEDAFQISGDMAGYAEPSGLYCREATVQGKGRWVPRGESLSFQMDLTNISDNTVRRLVGMGTRSKKVVCDTQFLHVLEESPLATPLLYLELLPKNREWARRCEELLPAVSGARFEVPCLAADAPIVVDGRLDEAVWQRAYYASNKRVGVSSARPERSGAKMMAVDSPSGLYIAFKISKKSEEPVGLQLGILPRIGIPASSSAQALAAWHPGASPETRLMVEDHEAPWDCDWQCAFASDGELWTAEVFIPAASLKDSAAPRPGNVWRMNAALATWDTPGQARPVAQWGYPDFDEVLHGMIVQFVSADSQP